MFSLFAGRTKVHREIHTGSEATANGEHVRIGGLHLCLYIDTLTWGTPWRGSWAGILLFKRVKTGTRYRWISIPTMRERNGGPQEQQQHQQKTTTPATQATAAVAGKAEKKRQAAERARPGRSFRVVVVHTWGSWPADTLGDQQPAAKTSPSPFPASVAMGGGKEHIKGSQEAGPFR